MLYMLDTSVCVSLIRGHSPSGALPSSKSCLVSMITVAELEVGIQRSSRPREQRRVVEELLSCFSIRPFESGAVGHYGEIRADLERRGEPIGPLDFLIAAHARSFGAVVITGNTREFRRVKGLGVLEWT